ncbi:MAG: UDP-N-acetylmuramoyl-L-alanine--D-glutamate ligase [Gammaproteobacteria bacterium]
MNETASQPRTLVVGLGKTGFSCARYLASQGVEVAVADDRQHPPEMDHLLEELPEVPLFIGGFDHLVFERAQRIVVSPGVPLSTPLIEAAIARDCEVIGDIELFVRHASAPIVAITGSNGKSTVTTLVYEMARQAGRDVRVGGNLGTPVLDLLSETEPDLYVIELSSFQLELVYSLQAQVAVVLNISKDHMDRYASVKAYAEAKQTVYRNSRHAIVNRDDATAASLVDSDKIDMTYGLSKPRTDQDFGLLALEGESWLAQGNIHLLQVARLRIAGSHNVSNSLAALALGTLLDLPMPVMLDVITTFTGLRHRTQWVAEINTIRWYNDSKATNIGAALAAIQGVAGPVVLIAGGQGKGADFTELAEGIGNHLRAVVLLGEDADKIGHALGSRVDCYYVSSMERAVAKAQSIAKSGDAVLLSPACASFDMFAHYEARGDAFIQAVERLIKT